MPEIIFIVNPISGRGSGLKSLPAVHRLAAQYSLNYRVETTEKPRHAIDLARESIRQGCQTIVAVGGDGTANEVLNGIMTAISYGEGEATLGLISVGRGNDFAFSLGIPKGIEQGFQILTSGNTRRIDVGLVKGGDYPQGRYFGNGVGIGFDTIVGFEALKMTYLQGYLSYIVAALKTIYLFNQAPKLYMDAKSFKDTRKVLMLSIMNGRRMGGGFLMAPEASNEDGLFDLCIAEEVSRMQILGLIPKFMAGTQGTHPAVQFHRSDCLNVTALEGVLPVHADGETICIAGKDLNLEMIPRGVRVVTQ
jgi:YegS/Rv2252/BmrU family lipid kinase